MEKIDWLKYKFHPSSLGLIMTDARSGPGLGETCKDHLMDCYVKERYGREKDISNKYIDKGNMVEEDSITLYSREKKEYFTKNDKQVSNEFLIGTPDVFTGPEIMKAIRVKDFKSSWDIHTFFHVMAKPINKRYWWQIQGYCDITGAEGGDLIYCLNNTPEPLINDEKRRLAWKMGVIDPDASELFQEACIAIEKEMTFDDIPLKERWIAFAIQRDQKLIDKSHERIIECREFLAALPQ